MEGISTQLFPTDGVVPEDRQIGRAGAIDRLARRLISGQNTLLLEPRRVGKTSVALAALDHCRKDHDAVTFVLDLLDGARTPKMIAEAVISQAKKQNVGSATTKLRGVRALGRTASILKQPGVAEAAEILEEGDLGKIVSSVADGLSGKKLDFELTLRAVEADASISKRPVIMLIDEVQALGTWGDIGDEIQEVLASAMKRPGQHLTFVFTGSKRGAVKQLFAEGRPLHYSGLAFNLDDIATEDWQVGLRDRFQEAGYEIHRDLLEDILDASAGHPLRTMQICAHVHEWAESVPAKEVSGAVVLRGITAARDHPSWKEADE